MKKDEIIYLEEIVEGMLSNLFKSNLLKEDESWDGEEESKEEKCIKKIINILEDRISYY
jgi:hypothetical protein